MYNLIKMNLYQLIHSISIKILILCTIGLALFCIAMTKVDLNALENEPVSATEAEMTEPEPNQTDIQFGIYTETPSEWVTGKISYPDLLTAQLQSKILLVLIAVFTTIFVAAERKNGFIKNIAGHFPNRGIMVAAKLIAIAVQVLIMFAIFALFNLIFSFSLLGDRITLGSATEFLKLTGIQYLLHFAFACLITFLCLLTNSSAMSMTVGILLSGGLISMILGMIEHAIQITLWKSFHFTEYTLDYNIASINAESTSKLITTGVLTSLAFILATTAFSVLIVQKRDIR